MLHLYIEYNSMNYLYAFETDAVDDILTLSDQNMQKTVLGAHL